MPGTQVSYQVTHFLRVCAVSLTYYWLKVALVLIYSIQEGHWGFFLLPPWPGVGEVAVALRGFTARGSPYTVRVLALKLEEEGEGTEVEIYLILILNFDSKSKYLSYLSLDIWLLAYSSF